MSLSCVGMSSTITYLCWANSRSLVPSLSMLCSPPSKTTFAILLPARSSPILSGANIMSCCPTSSGEATSSMVEVETRLRLLLSSPTLEVKTRLRPLFSTMRLLLLRRNTREESRSVDPNSLRRFRSELRCVYAYTQKFQKPCDGFKADDRKNKAIVLSVMSTKNVAKKIG